MIQFLKSGEPDLKKLYQLIDMLLTEQRHQRMDLNTIKRQLSRLINDSKLQKQVDEYYEEKPPVEVDLDDVSDSTTDRS